MVVLVAVVVLINLGLIGFYAPVERTMGVVQKIFYYHLSSAWIGMLAFFVVFVASILYLRSRQLKWNMLAIASAELGTIFTTLVLITGPLWGRPVWNTWWTWDPRLITTLVMWFMYGGYVLIHHADLTCEQKPRIAAVYGIIAFVNVPFVFFSIRWWRSLHPVLVTTESSGLGTEMRITLFFSLFTFLLLYFTILWLRTRILTVKDKIQAMYQQRRFE